MNIINLKYWWSNNNNEFIHHCDRVYTDPIHIISYSWFIDGIRILFDFFGKDEVELDLIEIARKFFHHHFYDYPYDIIQNFISEYYHYFWIFIVSYFYNYQDDFCDFRIVSSSWYVNRLNFWIHEVIWKKIISEDWDDHS